MIDQEKPTKRSNIFNKSQLNRELSSKVQKKKMNGDV